MAKTSRKKTENRQESASSGDDSLEDSKASPPPRRILTRKRSSASVTVNAEDDDEMVQDSSASDQSIESKDDEVMNAPNGVKIKKIGNRKGSWDCETCGKSLLSKQGLMRHIRTHTGEKPYKCDLCPQRFASLSNFRDHRRIHFAPSLECIICKKKFTGSSNLRVHRQRHLPPRHECEFCQKKFTTSRDLTRHRNGIKGHNQPCEERLATSRRKVKSTKQL